MKYFNNPTNIIINNSGALKNATFIILVLVVFFLAGCVQSLYPLFTEKDIGFKESLIGKWTDKNGYNMWTFQKSKEFGYVLINSQREFPNSNSNNAQGDTCMFEAHLIQLGKYYFIDVFPEELENKVQNDFYTFHLMPVHTIYRIWFDDEKFRVAMLDNDWLKKMLHEEKIDIAHVQMDKQIILTAPTKELQLLVLKYAEDEEAFPNPNEYHRVQ